MAETLIVASKALCSQPALYFQLKTYFLTTPFLSTLKPRLPASFADHIASTPIAHHHGSPSLSFALDVPASLTDTSYIFVQFDGYCSLFSSPHHSPHSVISRNCKMFVIRIHDYDEMISVDWLKPACTSLDVDSSSAVITCSGRVIHRPQRIS